MPKVIASYMRLFAGVLATFVVVSTPVFAQRITPGDPSIGSYYYFVALDRRCPDPSAERNAALDKFKKHYVGNARTIFASYPTNVQREVFAKLDRLESSGPTNEEIAPFFEFIDGATPRELGQACASAASEIAERMAMEVQIGEAARKSKQGIK